MTPYRHMINDVGIGQRHFNAADQNVRLSFSHHVLPPGCACERRRLPAERAPRSERSAASESATQQTTRG